MNKEIDCQSYLTLSTIARGRAAQKARSPSEVVICYLLFNKFMVYS